MRKLTDSEVKKFELDILLEIDRFCRENGLRYFLAYGTLIGAVRHKGFIPWDDDIDINMTRADYNRMVESYNAMNPGGRYKLVAPGSSQSRHSFVKLIDTHTVKIEGGTDYSDGYLGIDVDIFPLDGQPEDEETFEKWYRKLIGVYDMYCYIVYSSVSLKRRIIAPFIRLFKGGPKRLLAKAEKLHALYPYEGARYVGAVESSFNTKGNRFDAAWFKDSTQLEFEGHMLSAPAGYDKILRKVYGDYMKLPPAEQQVTHHTNDCYLKEDGDDGEKI